MTNQTAQDTIRQMLNDWNNLTAEQRAEAQAIAAEQAAHAYADFIIDGAIASAPVPRNWTAKDIATINTPLR